MTESTEPKPSINQLMKRQKKTCRSLGTEIGISASVVSRWGSHKLAIADKWVPKLATALKTTRKKIAEMSA